MGARISHGFTIIETVLFLSVTGLLVMGVLIGTGTALNRQRYRDSVESFKDLMQTQYAEMGSVKNARSNTWNCDASATPTTGGTEIRGQSDCLIVGRYMRIEGQDISIYTVLARQTSTTVRANDIATLDNNYAYNVSLDGVETRKMEWGTQLAWPTSGAGSKSPSAPRLIGILFIRSPESGGIYTFTSDTIPAEDSIGQATFKSIINAGVASFPGQGQRNLCVQSSGLFPSGDMSVYLSDYAASASSVEVRSNDFMSDQGISTRC